MRSSVYRYFDWPPATRLTEGRAARYGGDGLKGASVTITVDITPEVEAALARQAAAHGRAVESYAASLLEEAVHLPVAHRAAAPASPPAKDMVELFAPLRGLNLDFERDRDTGRDINL